MIGLIAYDVITRQNSRWENVAVMGLTFCVAAYCYGVWWGLAFVQAMALYLLFYNDGNVFRDPSAEDEPATAEPAA